jgi:cephalosporin-C deacetylase-like acetyl esterase
MHTIKKYIDQQLNQPLDLKQNDACFSFMSSNQTTIHGKIFRAHKPNLKCVIMYHGLGAHTATQGYIELSKVWNEKGYDVIGIDMRNQGGKTSGVPSVSDYGLYVSGYQTLDTYYYKELYIDSYLLVEVAKLIFPNHILIANGGSQGGALALVVTALHQDIKLCIADMPSNTDIPYLISHSESGFKDFNHLLKLNPKQEKHVKGLLSHIDVLTYASHIKVPTLLSSGTKDQVCPTVTTHKLFDALTCKKDLILYDGYGHGGYDHLHFDKKFDFILKNVG